ncbi:hypothetical protein STCU_09271 [Strigomonas culicis]|uniref:Uncharacterized protein n=1 Tax=Strigomonas culicis TaxID=28005 RepID=S9TTI1_9TRYP|nr:hypothetical protein STCU_09271 [Strigomonas culicis]|eukprot:EPY19838.1 hypothetical protein STCU_09271 [Strigomonas culicis]
MESANADIGKTTAPEVTARGSESSDVALPWLLRKWLQVVDCVSYNLFWRPTVHLLVAHHQLSEGRHASHVSFSHAQEQKHVHNGGDLYRLAWQLRVVLAAEGTCFPRPQVASQHYCGQRCVCLLLRTGSLLVHRVPRRGGAGAPDAAGALRGHHCLRPWPVADDGVRLSEVLCAEEATWPHHGWIFCACAASELSGRDDAVRRLCIRVERYRLLGHPRSDLVGRVPAVHAAQGGTHEPPRWLGCLPSEDRHADPLLYGKAVRPP